MLAQTTAPSSDLANLIAPLVPWVIVFAIVLFIIRRQSKRTAKYVERAREHMAAVETKLDILIDLLKRRGDGG